MRFEVENLLSIIAQDREANAEKTREVYRTLPSPGYTIPMAWRCAITMSNELVDSVPRYSSADHGSIFKSLLNVVRQLCPNSSDQFAGPHFDKIIHRDPAILSCLNGEYEQLSLLNFEVSLSKGYWRIRNDEARGLFRVSLSPSQRRSAITLLDHKVEFLELSPEMQSVVTDAATPKAAVSLILAKGMNEVAFVREAVPEAWKALEQKVGFSIENAAVFHAFSQYLFNQGFMWFSKEDLSDGFRVFVEAQELPSVSESTFNEILEFFSAPPERVASWGISVPFIRFGNWLAYWPFVHHILPPSLTFLSLIMRQKPDDWNNTVGSKLADVSKAITDKLTKSPNLHFVTTKVRAGTGDVDLGIFDSQSRVLLLCEIKTVFDRFRTNYQFSNFLDQRVNFEKAKSQLDLSTAAIASGDWPMSRIFNGIEDGPPSKILPLVLTWYDQHDPWVVQSSSTIASCNFRVFQHLFAQARGDLEEVHKAIWQLSRVYCVAMLAPSRKLPAADGEHETIREVQTDLLPSEDHLRDMPLSSLVRSELASLPKLPLDWKAQLASSGDSPDDFHVYEFAEM